jgi:hypothetical protein
MPLCYAEQNHIATGQELKTKQHRKTACTLKSVQYTREEKFTGKDDAFHISECVKRNEKEYRQRKLPFHGAADSTSTAEIPQSAQSPCYRLDETVIVGRLLAAARIVPPSKTLRPAVEPTHPPMQRIPNTISPE